MQAAICYTTSDVHTIRYFVGLANEMERAGADSICIKDMAGVLTPDVAFELVREIKPTPTCRCRCTPMATAGIGQMTYLKAVEAGADIIDTCISPFAEGTSQPATESMALALEDLGYRVNLDSEKLDHIASYFMPIRDRFLENGILNPKVLSVEPKALLYKVPVECSQTSSTSCTTWAWTTNRYTYSACRGAPRPCRAGLSAACDATLADGGHAGAYERALGRALQDCAFRD